MSKILIIEDDKDINNMLEKLLQYHDYETMSAYSGTEGVLLHQEDIDLILLDLMLPGKSGEEIIKELKEKHPVPIIVMSAIEETKKKVELLNLGADDYVTKPFHQEELLARIKVQLRNKTKRFEDKVLHYKDITLNKKNRTVICYKKEVDFTKHEFDLLCTLMEHPNQVFTKSILFDKVWGEEAFADDNTLNVHISKIRNKLKECNPKLEYIETVWSIGYKMKE